MEFHARVAAYIRQNQLLDEGQSLLVGVSGGPDSRCLLHCLIELDYQPVVAHFDHRSRPESGEDAEHVRHAAASYGVPFVLGHRPNDNEFTEEGARHDRYRFLADAAIERGIASIAVGHTASDQVETVLMHLIRGAGPRGLRGMLPVTDLSKWVGMSEFPSIALVRPLLEIWRDETETYCAERSISVRIDPTNQNSAFFRNRLRNELLPELRKFNPRIHDVLLRTSKVMAAEADAIQTFVAQHWDQWVESAGEGVLAFHTEALTDAPLALQRAAVRRAIEQLAPNTRDIGFDMTDTALEAMRDGRRLTLTGGLDLLPMNGQAVLRTSGARIMISDFPQVEATPLHDLTLPFRIELENGWELIGSAEMVPGEPPIDPSEAWFDADTIEGSLELRTSIPGDRFAPFGMSGTMKLSDLFVNRKVPWPARERYPVVTCGETVIWIPGLHRSRSAPVTSTTRAVIRMRLLDNRVQSD